MSKQFSQGILMSLLGLAIGAGSCECGTAAMVDLTSSGASGHIGAATFEQVSPQSTGTGRIDSFLRIQAKDQEAAYNTSAKLGKQYDQHGGSQFNRDLLLSSVPIVNLNGVANYQFLLDIDQVKTDKDSGNLLSLNQLEVFLTGTPEQSGGSYNKTTGRLNTAGMTDLSLVWDMNPGGGTGNGVTLNYALNPGNGAGDMFFYLPTSLFSGVSGQYVLLYSEFGKRPGAYPSNSGFEEWAVLTVVPEPTTIIAGALLLVPFGLSVFRGLRKT